MKCKECDRDMVCVDIYETMLEDVGIALHNEYKCKNNYFGKIVEFPNLERDDIEIDIKREEDRLCKGCGENESANGVDFCADCILETVKKVNKEFYETINQDNEGGDNV